MSAITTQKRTGWLDWLDLLSPYKLEVEVGEAGAHEFAHLFPLCALSLYIGNQLAFDVDQTRSDASKVCGGDFELTVEILGPKISSIAVSSEL